MRNKGIVFLWTIIGAIALGVGGFFLIRYLVRSSHLSAFKDHVNEYLVIASSAGGPAPGGTVKGKIITVDKQANDIDWIYFDLPDNLQANSPDEVGTIVVLEWVKEEVGSYSNGSKAYRQNCVVTVVDKASRSVVARQQIVGGDPPQRKKSSESGTGPKPTRQIVDFLAGLPRS